MGLFPSLKILNFPCEHADTDEHIVTLASSDGNVTFVMDDDKHYIVNPRVIISLSAFQEIIEF